MLRKALDAAEKQQQLLPPVDSETTSLATGNDEYGSLAKTSEGDDESGVEDSTFAFGDDDDDDDEMDLEPRRTSSLYKLFSWVHGLFLVIANVDNLWDSPAHRRTRKTWCVVSFWFTMLATAYALERTTFKLLVDRTGPFRLFSAVVLTATHAMLLGLGMVIARLVNKTWGRGFKTLGIPLVDVGLMALLDSVHLLLVIISGSHIPPTLIVILVQLTIPLTCLFSQFVHPDGCCTMRRPVSSSTNALSTTQNPPIRGCGGLNLEHLMGSLIITLAVLTGMAPTMVSFFKPEFFASMDVLPIRTALNTVIFTLGCIPAAASQLYKEHVFLLHKQPVNPSHFNLLLSVFQFVFLLIVSPLVYGLQGLSGATKDDVWTTLYPSSQISDNFKDGLACFLGTLDDERQESAYPEDAECDYSLLIVFTHVMSIIIIGVAVDKIINAGATMIMYRGISAGIVLSVISLYNYDMHDPDFNYGPMIDSLHFVCTLTLILGSEVYHRVSLQDTTFETIYPEMENLYDEVE